LGSVAFADATLVGKPPGNKAGIWEHNYLKTLRRTGYELAKNSFVKAKYAFDNTMSKGLLPLIALLSLGTALFILLVSVVVAALKLFPEDEDLSLGEIIWASLLRTLDPGTMGQDSGTGFRAAMLAVTLFGIILVAALIGIISNALNSKLEQLRKGKSKVIEKGHTVILGWNSKGIQLIRELVISNGPDLKTAIVILADIDKVLLEDEVLRRVGDLGKTKLVVRSGRPMSRTDLSIVSINTAKAVIILSPDFSEDADTFAIKTCMAVRSLENPPGPETSIVGEIRDASNIDAAELVSEGSVHWVLVEEIVNRLIVQTCRQSGLSSVFTDLLDFTGSELYILRSPQLQGHTYGDISLMLESSVAVGVIQGVEVNLNPNPAFVFEQNDALVVVAEDRSKLALSVKAKVQEDLFVENAVDAQRVESTLILGSNSGLEVLVSELDKDSAAGSKIVVVSPFIEKLDLKATNIDLSLVVADPTKKRVLESVEVASFDHIIIIANRDLNDVQQADAKTLHTLLQVRALTNGKSGVNIVSEILDDHNRKLAESARADDFIVSDKIVSHVISQISVNKHLGSVFNELFAAGGERISMLPVENFILTGVPVSFDSVIASVSKSGKSAIGYRLEAEKNELSSLHGVRLNPIRTSQVVFSSGDTLIVVE
jgi:Trk K+ transport system NAD-binding subunit